MTSPLFPKLQLTCVVAGTYDLPLEALHFWTDHTKQITRSSATKGAICSSGPQDTPARVGLNSCVGRMVTSVGGSKTSKRNI